MPANLVALYDDAAAGCDNYWIIGAVLAAQGKKESSFRANAVGSDRRPEDRGKGIAQFTDGTWKTWGQGGDPFKPEDAIPAQARFMCALGTNPNVLGAYHAMGGKGDKAALPFMLAAFNSGPGRLHSTYRNGDGLSFAWKGLPPFKITQDYVALILEWSGSYENLEPATANAIKATLAESNHNLWLYYGWRTLDEQTQLWNDKVAQMDGNEVLANKWVARPGTSTHERGLAGDINGDQALLAQLAPKHGLCFPYSWESWHVELCK